MALIFITQKINASASQCQRSVFCDTQGAERAVSQVRYLPQLLLSHTEDQDTMHLGEVVVLISIMCALESAAELPPGVDRNTYCESCLAAVKELKGFLREPSTQPSEARVRTRLASVCKADTFNGYNLPTDNMVAACRHLLDTHDKEFLELLLSRRTGELDVLLCYELSLACVGVRRRQQENREKAEFTDMDSFLQGQKEKVRFVNPVHSNSTVSAREEL
ncbi:uncharacterized protein LOC136712345 [Amia ocellicauda]|uniref:uncharacterized protein LOC136712345 n=1 Tax=Amia ocellicauda TaxID=2972642 RepID=UPI003463B497